MAVSPDGTAYIAKSLSLLASHEECSTSRNELKWTYQPALYVIYCLWRRKNTGLEVVRFRGLVRSFLWAVHHAGAGPLPESPADVDGVPLAAA